MKRISSLLLLVMLLGGLVSAQELNWSKIDPLLEQQLRENPATYLKVTVYLNDQVDLPSIAAEFGPGSDLHARRVAVVSALKQKAQETQGPLLALMNSHTGVQPGSVTSHWISNDIRANMNYQAIADLSHEGAVDMLYWEPPTVVDDADAAPNAPVMFMPESVGGREPGLNVINAPALWAMGYTGVGKKVLIIDSGVSLTHPALTRNYYGNEVGDALAWYAPQGAQAPFDCDEHGTHVTGVTVGMELSSRDTFGVAFNAMWMGSPAVDGNTSGTCVNDVDDLDALQWALDPDGNSSTSIDMPDVINGSYGTEPQFFNAGVCNGSIFKQRMEALEAASITFIQSAGNYGPGDSTMGVYKNISETVVNSFTVGAVNGGTPNVPIMSYSSRGPSRCGGTGSLRFKPEVSAPGHNVRSCVPGGGFKLLPGTSFSAPHVAGAALLLHEAFPNATSVDVKEALYYSAVDKGMPGEDNAYGMGVIDVLAAYNYLINEGLTPAPVSRAKDAVLAEAMVEDVICGTSVAPEIMIENNGKTVMTAATIEYNFSDGTNGTYNWTGSLAPGGTEMVTLPAQTLPVGRYDLDIEITTVDGQADYYYLDNSQSLSFSLLGEDDLVVDNTVVSPAAACSGSEAVLTASTSSPNRIPAWYSDQGGSNLLYVGESFVTPAITSSQFYYVGTVGQDYVGMTNKDQGTSFPNNSIASFLEFEVYTTIQIKSVVLYVNSTESRTIQIRDANDQILAAKPTGILQNGENRVPVSFTLNPGTYRMGLGGANAGLFATISNIVFPYEVPGVMSINRSDNGFYNFFYDWEIEYKGACDLEQAAVSVAPGVALAMFTADKQVVDLTSGESVSFTNTSVGANSYLWNFGDGNTSTDQNPTHQYQAAGEYLVTLQAITAAGCSDVDSLTIVADGTLGLEDLEKLYGSLQVYPNPGTGLFTLEADLKQAYDLEAEVVNLVGQTVWQRDAAPVSRSREAIDLRQVPDGVYLLKVTIDGRTLTEKLIKTR